MEHCLWGIATSYDQLLRTESNIWNIFSILFLFPARSLLKEWLLTETNIHGFDIFSLSRIKCIHRYVITLYIKHNVIIYIYIYIYIYNQGMAYGQHEFYWFFFAINCYQPTLSGNPLDGIQCQYRGKECKFLLINQCWCVHV